MKNSGIHNCGICGWYSFLICFFEILYTMATHKRPFYIMAHNPNSVKEAEDYLASGANALGPDIIYHNNQFYVSHNHHLFYNDVPKLEDYLKDLKQLIETNNYNLALIVFDSKDTTFDINHFIAIVKQHFSGGVCDGVAILVTNPNEIDFLLRYNNAYDNVGVGADDCNTPPAQLEKIFKAHGIKNFVYADGIFTLLDKPGVFKNMQEAKNCKSRNQPHSYKLIYTWVLFMEGSMRKYLNSYVDGIMVDLVKVGDLKKLVESDCYNAVYKLALNGHNPFNAPLLPTYHLLVTTSNEPLAGTNAEVCFTLTGTNGKTLKGLPFDASFDGAMERGSVTFATLEGEDIGEIESISLELATNGLTSDWLPEKIIVESDLLENEVIFNFEKDDWVTYKGGLVTKKVIE